ncbi:3-deoxy-D-manno-octulosonic acid transferase [Cesiribacter andamanensis]|uniref:3-deoxy-D-manno-octulosonic acid transferase n=1 Tax=Cesiribacter andamanensis AMV16 TaxID=1279009 RepID=M7N8I2_9BACT|nr:glycosyltransferase N-terminal domain-containing protein [Cesiribacter andamanensis]EMR03577.1 3-deoxy-D-manno-octulosonic-acid transferase [Cesiribacter andamanensis AMV16]
MSFQKWLYTLSLGGYAAALRLAAPLHPKARQMVAGRRGLLEQIRTGLQGNTAPVVWFHCASLGEFEQGRPLIEALREAHPDHKIFLTFFSPSGYEVRQGYAGADWVFYLPLDSPAHARQFLDAVQPRLAVFVKYEFWHYYLQELHRRQIPTLLISAIFRHNQLFFKSHGAFYRQMLGYFSQIFVQGEESQQLLSSIGVTHVQVAGDTRFDRVLSISRQTKEIPLARAFAQDKPVLVVGSSWPADITVLAPLVQRYQGRIKVIIAPHELGESGLRHTEDTLGVNSLRYSTATEATAAAADVLLVDTIGLLSSLYALGHWAYVGGSFGKGLHNTLEAAVWGIPVFFGNRNYQKFAEARDLIRRGGAFAVANSAELLASFGVLFEDEEKRKAAGALSADYVRQQAGATAHIMHYLNKLL